MFDTKGYVLFQQLSQDEQMRKMLMRVKTWICFKFDFELVVCL